jgi:hypothetical protein
MFHVPVGFTRRQFGMTLAAVTSALSATAASADPAAPWSGPAVVRKVFVGVPNTTWPRPDLDFKQEIAGINGKLGELERNHPGLVRFTGGEWLKAPGDVESWANSLNHTDARKFVEGYTGGLHRVVFYGDYILAIERMGRLMGFRVVKEI